MSGDARVTLVQTRPRFHPPFARRADDQIARLDGTCSAQAGVQRQIERRDSPVSRDERRANPVAADGDDEAGARGPSLG